MTEEKIDSADPAGEEATCVVLCETPEVDGSSPVKDHRVPVVGGALGPVRLISELGRGAMGVVFLGYHILFERTVAVKVLTIASPALRAYGIKRFADEARATAAVRDPHLVRIFEADCTGDTPYLVMEHVEGPTLAHVVARYGKLSPPVALGVLSQVSSGVARLHEHQIVHRDLKLGNVLLDLEGRAVVSDFGLAVTGAAPDPGAPSEPRLAGTPAYMAPEMFDGIVSPRSDVYAMGIMMVHLLFGKVPFEGTTDQIRHRHKTAKLPLKELAGQGVSRKILEIIAHCTFKQPAHRYQNGGELHAALMALDLDPTQSRLELKRLIEGFKMEAAILPA